MARKENKVANKDLEVAAAGAVENWWKWVENGGGGAEISIYFISPNLGKGLLQQQGQGTVTNGLHNKVPKLGAVHANLAYLTENATNTPAH